MSGLWQDLRYAVRGLKRSPGFTVAAVLTLALGIGANTAIFTLIDAAVLHPVPFPKPDRLTAIYQTSSFGDHNAVPYLNFLDWQRQSHTFEQLAAWRTDSFALTGHGEAEHLVGLMVSANLFSTLRVYPLIGRAFQASEDQSGAAPVALIGESLWTRRFGRDSGIVGRSLTLNGRPYLVIGIVPSMVRLDWGGPSTFANDVFVPIGLFDDPLFRMRGSAPGTHVIARLNPDVTLAQAQSDMTLVASHLANAYPESNRGTGANVVAFERDVVGEVGRVLWMLLGAVGFVLCIACANVANLSLARSLGRSREFAIRTALGARRGRLARQLVTESLVLALAGGVVGVALAAALIQVALPLASVPLPVMSVVTLNARVFIFAFVVSAGTGVLFGLAPARFAGRANLDEQLRAHGRGVAEQSGGQRALVVGQVALTLVLLVGAGLMARSLVIVLTSSVGFQPGGLTMLRTELPTTMRSTPDTIRQALSALEDRLAGIPGVKGVSVQVGSLPFAGDTESGFWRADTPERTLANVRAALYSAIGPYHFRTMGIPLVRGRVFTGQDDISHPLVVIVDEELARTVFGRVDVVGQRLHDGFEQTLEIVGVVGNVTHRGLDKDANARVRSRMYVPYAQLPPSATDIFASEVFAVVRSNVAPESLFRSIQGAIHAFDATATIHTLRPMNEIIASTQTQRRFPLMIVGMFALVALILSAVGIYGVVSYGVTRRTRDIGIRLALGAPHSGILGGVLREAGRITAVGVAIGLILALGLSRVVAALVFRVSALDPMTLAGMTLVLVLVTLVASYVPLVVLRVSIRWWHCDMNSEILA